MKRGEQNVNVPEGWVLVPIVPTEVMLDATELGYHISQPAWYAMVYAAPVPPVEQRGVAE